MPALAITDTNNLFGALEFSEKLAKSGVQPIIGAQTTVDFGDAAPSFLRGVERDNARAPIVLLAQNEAGYRNLMRLVSALWLDPTDGDEAHIPFAALDESNGLIALTGGPAGPDRPGAESGTWRPGARAGSSASPRSSARGSMSRSSATGSTMSARSSLSLSVSPTVSACPWLRPTSPISAEPSDYEAHDALLCVAEGAVISAHQRRRLSPEHRFKTRAEMTELFADLPEATEASVEIAVRCAYRPLTRKPILPRFSVAHGARCRRGAGAQAPGERGLERAPRRARPRARTHRGRLRPAPRFRARRHRQHDVRRLFPHRRRLHPMGEGARHPRRARARLGRGFGRRLGPHHHRSRPAAGLASCSSGSSTPNGSRCPISTSTSARTGATR